MDIGHTKGPWVAEAADIFGDHNIVLADRSEDCRAVAAVVSNMRDPLEVEANARLIAASPTMYDYIARKVRVGDQEASKIVEAINANS